MEGMETEQLNRYIVVYENRMVNQVQTFKVMAKNEFRAGRLFYLKHDRKGYHGCIQSISKADDHYWTEVEIRAFKERQRERELMRRVSDSTGQ